MSLCYHRIGIPDGVSVDRGVFSATPEAFESQVRLLKKNYDIVTPANLDDVLKLRKGRHVLITFDDGYRDNYEIAFPILSAHRVAAIFFVGTGFLDQRLVSWWDEVAWMVRTSRHAEIAGGKWFSAPVRFDAPDREQAIQMLLTVCKSLPAEETSEFLEYLTEATGVCRYQPSDTPTTWLTWDMVRTMRQQGMVIGGHGVGHRILSRLSPEDQEKELTECADRFRAELGEPMIYFSYPEGSPMSFNAATRLSLQRLGVLYGFSFYGGYRRYDDWDSYDIRRVSVMMETTPALFRAMFVMPRFFT